MGNGVTLRDITSGDLEKGELTGFSCLTPIKTFIELATIF